MQEFQYMLLGRLKQDCDYFLAYGQRNPKNLWAGDVHNHIKKMKELYDNLAIKPEWLTMNEIIKYENSMTIDTSI